MGFEEPYFKRTEEEMLEELLSHPEEGLLELTEKQWKFLRENGTVRQPFGNHGHFKNCLPVSFGLSIRRKRNLCPAIRNLTAERIR